MYAEKLAYATASEVSQVERPQSAFGEASITLEEARSLAHRVSDLVDRLCGTRLAEANKADSGVPSSIFASLRDDASRTSAAIRSAMDQLNRLDRELP